MNSHSSMDLLLNMGMDIDDFVNKNVDNYNDAKGYSITPNKTTSRTISMSLSKASVDYATRIEWLNDISEKVETRDPINSLQLSYTEPKKIQINKTTDHKSIACLQQGIEDMPALNSTLLRCVDDDVINIQLPYDPNTPTEPEL